MVYRMAQEDKVLALAEALAVSALELAYLKNAKQVNRIVVDVNRLAELNTEALKQLMADLLVESVAAQAAITFREMPLRVSCRCGHNGHARFVTTGVGMAPACIKCGRTDVEMKTPKEPAAVLGHVLME